MSRSRDRRRKEIAKQNKKLRDEINRIDTNKAIIDLAAQQRKMAGMCMQFSIALSVLKDKGLVTEEEYIAKIKEIGDEKAKATTVEDDSENPDGLIFQP